VDAYFAQHDVPSMVSDLLFELGFHRPKDVGKFMSTFVDRRFRLDGSPGGKQRSRTAVLSDVPMEDDFSTVEVRAAVNAMGADAARAGSLLEEARTLRRKYREHQPRAPQGGEAASADKGGSVAIAWPEFRADYERLLAILGSPQVWAFCERRLAQLRGLFEVHEALNGEAEEAEALAAPPLPRVDCCVQLARALAPCRVMELFRRRVEGEDAKGAEVAPGKTLADLAEQLGRPPCPSDLTWDADVPMPSASTLCGVFSRISNHARGQFLAEAVLASFGLLEATDAASGGAAYAEYRLPLSPESGSWGDMARWAEEFNVKSDRARWVIQLPQAAYAGLKERRSVLNFGELLENAFGPPTTASMEGAEKRVALHKLLEDVCAVELAAAPHGPQALGAEADREPSEWTAAQSPPLAYQLFHAWTRLKALNASRAVAGLQELPLRCAAASAEPLACGYMLGATGVSRCGSLPEHAPLQYLFVLDEVDVAVSLSSRRSLGGAGGQGAQAFSRLLRAGVRVSLCTEDPTISQQCDQALALEYALARSALGLSQADVAEVALNSSARCGFPELRAPGEAEGRDGAGAEGPKDKSIRERYRRGRRDAEAALLARLAPLSAAGAGAPAAPKPGPASSRSP